LLTKYYIDIVSKWENDIGPSLFTEAALLCVVENRRLANKLYQTVFFFSQCFLFVFFFFTK